MGKTERVYDIMRLPTKGKFYKPVKSGNGEATQLEALRVERLKGMHEDILNSRELLLSNSVWSTMYDLTVMDKDSLPFSDLMYPDIFAFMLHTRKTAYGSIVEQPNTQIVCLDGSTITDTAVFDLENVSFGEPSDAEQDENGFFRFSLPTSKKVVRFRVLTDLQERMAIESAESLKKAMNLAAAPTIKKKLEASIVDIDGETDRFKIDAFISGHDFLPSDSMALRKYQNSIMPTVSNVLPAKGLTSGKQGNARIDLGFSFFFPAYGI